jgi:hypothetical protein
LEVGAAFGALGNWQLQNYLHAKSCIKTAQSAEAGIHTHEA